MICSLYHKNTEVLQAQFDFESNTFGKIINIISKERLPVGIENIPEMTLSQALNFWWGTRLIPDTRKGLDKTDPYFSKAFNNANGFNLSDQYWIKSADSEMTWEDGNFFKNAFSEDIGKYISGVGSSKVELMRSDSPDLFSNGEQNKRWIVERGVRKLLKYGISPYYEQPFNEVLTSELCRRLGFFHVPYSFVVKGKTQPVIYSTCPCFIDENTEYVPAGFIKYLAPKDKKISEYEHLINCCEKAGMEKIPQIKDELSKMIFIDFILANTDRHYGNFGFIRDANTLQWKGLAPIFDTGNSMFYENPTSDLRKSKSLSDNVISKNFAKTQKKQLLKFADPIASLNIDFSKLQGIDDYYKNIISSNPKIDEERQNLLVNLLLERIATAQNIIYSNNQVTLSFLALIKNDVSSVPFAKKISQAAQKISSQNIYSKKMVESYLRALAPSNPQDLENKIQLEISKKI